MKKRLLSLLLTVCMVVMLFTGLAATASAADTIKGYLVSYTLQAGDTIYGVCEAKGIDFDTNLNLIAKINNITNYNYMMPGKVLWLPSASATTAAPYYSLLAHTLAAGETPASLCQSYGVDYNGSYNLLAALNNNLNVFMAGQVFILPLYINPTAATTTTTTTAATVTPTTTTTTTATAAAPTVTTAIPAGDTVSYYLAQHVLQSGETVSGVCAALGVDFGKEDARIRSINNIANYNTMLPGKVLLLPVGTKPTTGSYYQVMAHTVAAGDTVYDLCTKYGLNFGTYTALIQRLNNRNDLATFYVGQTLYMPQYVAAAGTGSPTAAQAVASYAGTYNTTGTGNPATAAMTVATTGQFSLSVNTLTQFNGAISAVKAGYAALTGLDPNGKNIHFELSQTTAGYDLKVTESAWNLLTNGTVFHLTRTGAPAAAAPTTTGGAGYNPAAATPIPVATPTPDGYTAPAAGTATTVVPAATTTGAAANVPGTDTLSYLIIPHVLQSGETVSGICADMGVDFMSNYDRIMQLSNIADYNYLLPGKVILVPSTAYPPSGPYYKVMAHTLVAGDTVYGLCGQYGLDYTSNAAFLQRLNNRNDLSTFYVGQTLYLPVYVAG